MKRLRFLMLIFLVLSLFCSCQSHESNIQENMKRGEQIVGALENYRKDHGVYPTMLDRLVNEYISQLPQTIGGEEFIYKTWSDTYTFGFDVANNRTLACGYLPRYQTWECSHADH